MNKTPQPQIDGAFMAMMQSHRDGSGLTDLSDAMRKTALAVAKTGRPGSFTLKITVRRATAAGFVVEDDIKVTPPKLEKTGSMFYGSEDGALLRDNPKQTVLQFQTVPTAEPQAATIISPMPPTAGIDLKSAVN